MAEIQTYYYTNFRTNTMLPRWSTIWTTLPRSPQLPLAIVKKTLYENHFRAVQKTMNREPPYFKLGDRVYFKNKTTRKWDLKWRPRYSIVCIEHDRHYLHIENQAMGKTRSCNIKDIVLKPLVGVLEHQHAIQESQEVHQPPYQLTNYHAQQLKMNTLLI